MITCALISEKGQRAQNEDAVGVFEHGSIRGFAVCDGLGGHGMGEVASAAAAEQFREAVCTCETVDQSFFARYFEAVQNRLLQEQAARNVPNQMKTTVAALMTDAVHARIGHIGDSRVYVFDASSAVIFRTLDHSVPEALRRAGMITESEIRHHPDRNKLLKVLGSDKTNASGTVSEAFPLESVRAFLLCTDGFWEHVSEERMCAFLQRAASVQEWLDRMTEEAVRNGMQGQMDNYSAIAVWT